MGGGGDEPTCKAGGAGDCTLNDLTKQEILLPRKPI